MPCQSCAQRRRQLIERGKVIKAAIASGDVRAMVRAATLVGQAPRPAPADKDTGDRS